MLAKLENYNCSIRCPRSFKTDMARASSSGSQFRLSMLCSFLLSLARWSFLVGHIRRAISARFIAGSFKRKSFAGVDDIAAKIEK